MKGNYVQSNVTVLRSLHSLNIPKRSKLTQLSILLGKARLQCVCVCVCVSESSNWSVNVWQLSENKKQTTFCINFGSWKSKTSSLLLMAEILHHVWNPINNGINYQPQLVQDFSHQQYEALKVDHTVGFLLHLSVWHLSCLHQEVPLCLG